MTLSIIFWTTYSKLYRNVRYSMSINCAYLVAALFLFCHEKDFMLSLLDNNQTDVSKAFNYTSRYLDYLACNDNPYFQQTENHIYPTELKVSK